MIAVEGQTVDIDFAEGIVYVDGEALEEDYIREPTYTAEGTEFPLTVPEGSIFVMGDNRTAPATAGTTGWVRWIPGMSSGRLPF